MNVSKSVDEIANEVMTEFFPNWEKGLQGHLVHEVAVAAILRYKQYEEQGK